MHMYTTSCGYCVCYVHVVYTSRVVRVVLAQGPCHIICIVPNLTDDPRRESDLCVCCYCCVIAFMLFVSCVCCVVVVVVVDVVVVDDDVVVVDVVVVVVCLGCL